MTLNKASEILQSNYIMSFPDFEKPSVLHYDASELELGAVLLRQQNWNLKEIN